MKELLSGGSLVSKEHPWQAGPRCKTQYLLEVGRRANTLGTPYMSFFTNAIMRLLGAQVRKDLQDKYQISDDDFKIIEVRNNFINNFILVSLLGENLLSNISP